MYFSDALIAENSGGFGMVEWEEGDLENLDNVMAEKGAPENYIFPPELRKKPKSSPHPLMPK